MRKRPARKTATSIAISHDKWIAQRRKTMMAWALPLGLAILLTFVLLAQANAKTLAGERATDQTQVAEAPVGIDGGTFFDPMSRELIRLVASLDAGELNRPVLATRLGEIAARPQRFGEDVVVFLALRTAYWNLVHEPWEIDTKRIRGLLWETALRIEERRVSVARNSLISAQRELLQAIVQKMNQLELDKRADRLVDAIRTYEEVSGHSVSQSVLPKYRAIFPKQTDNSGR